ncbi:DUF4382 domain-containing protein [uncultured Roseivirga sp.]|uniref:DUF4382 domain-containing protein n=1 Tax=uncultured Roseivirga sp. TaxID=543088 RepID=UPI0030D92C3E|tara:strand:- start:501158 stop:502078 length:921 start_codon:yes stop_codon:yes gene_type:complete
MKNLKLLIATLLIIPTLIFTSCDDDNSNELDGTGTARLEATDAAVDAENITGVFLSVEEAQFIANGQIQNSITFDSPKEFNLMDYQNGETYILGETELEAGAYDEIRLILTASNEAYVKYVNGSTDEVDVPSGSTSGYKIMGDFDVMANGMTELVLDVDLRKALVKRGNGEFNLRPTARLITKSTAGMIEGAVDEENMQNADKVVVYAYLEGTFQDSEMNEPTEGNARFENSINSAVADANGNFTLAFMPEGDYELIVSTYDKNELEGTFEFETATKVEVSIGGTTTSVIEVQAKVVTNLLINLFQ